MGRKKQTDVIKISLPDTIEKLKQLEKTNFTQSNYLVEAVFLQPFKELELKVLALISKYINDNNFSHFEKNTIKGLKERAGNFLKISIAKEDFCEFLHLNPLNFYQQISVLSKELLQKSILVESLSINASKKGKKFIGMTLFSYIGCDNSQAIFGINPSLQPYLQHLKSNFTILSLEHIADMNSSYAIKIYQLLKQYETVGKRNLKIEELKKILCITDLYKENFKDFRKKVLEISQKNINESSDIEISFTPKKNGKRVEEIEFLIKTKKTHLQQAIKAFKKQMDVYFSRTSPFSLDQEHRLLHQDWIKSKKDITQNRTLFEKWIENTIESYIPESTTKLITKSIQEFGTPSWYSEFLQNNFQNSLFITKFF